MAYRKLEIDGVTYEYVIGTSNVHIKIPGGGSLDADVSEIGRVVVMDCGCGCGGNDCPHPVSKTAVTPADIRAYILAKV